MLGVGGADSWSSGARRGENGRPGIQRTRRAREGDLEAGGLGTGAQALQVRDGTQKLGARLEVRAEHSD